MPQLFSVWSVGSKLQYLTPCYTNIAFRFFFDIYIFEHVCVRFFIFVAQTRKDGEVSNMTWTEMAVNLWASLMAKKEEVGFKIDGEYVEVTPVEVSTFSRAIWESNWESIQDHKRGHGSIIWKNAGKYSPKLEALRPISLRRPLKPS